MTERAWGLRPYTPEPGREGVPHQSQLQASTCDEITEFEAEPDDERRAALDLLPAWFVGRMMDDTWLFGLLLSNGQTLPIQHIEAVHRAADGSLWLDVLMAERGSVLTPGKYLYAPTSRLHASVNAAYVVAAFELADT
jgi:hypothetical protein